MNEKRIIPISIFIAATAMQSRSQTADLMPVPAKAVQGSGKMAIDGDFRIALQGVQDASVLAAARRTITRLIKQTGLPLTRDIAGGDATGAALVIRCERPRKPVQTWNEDESYRLDVTSSGAHLQAVTPLGALHGMETFLQLIARGPGGFTVAAVAIDDRPRFAWRGLHLDVSRHWMPIEVVRRTLDGMAAVKLNVFHWHLTDDQGFRMESQIYPKLTGLGSDGNFYTRDQVREVLAYARERGIRVVPEFDMPGHATSWLAGYPELASAPGPFRIERTWGILIPCLDPTKEAVYRFLDAFIGEMSGLFPDEYFHIGGDEVNGIQWDGNAAIQAFKREHGMKDNHDLQAYFNKRVQAIVSKHGKRMEGWDEILDPGLPKDILIQSWSGPKSLALAASSGYRGILSSGYYLDLIHPASAHYRVDPLGKQADALAPEVKARILGGEACMWTEYVSPETVDSRIWPRAAAIAERLWSPPAVTDIDSMYRRLDIMSGRLDAIGLTHRSSYLAMLRRLAGAAPVEPLKVLADVVEPVKEYARGSFQNYTQQTPLNRLVDAARPESEVARKFGIMVDHLSENRLAVRNWLTLWKGNAVKLEPAIRDSELLREVEPVSVDVSRLGAIGLQALDYREKGLRPPRGWLKEQKTFLDAAKKPRAEVVIMIAEPIGRLLNR
ncbi:MAG: family 20 glycosylhydrolase [Acidobacteriota bacterium]|nr:family 20 glycosylhydrolase [Acidobacteriota bacterium]